VEQLLVRERTHPDLLLASDLRAYTAGDSVKRQEGSEAAEIDSRLRM
jgi:hypothetical protein